MDAAALHHFNKCPQGAENILPAPNVLIRIRTFKPSVSATPPPVATSFCPLPPFLPSCSFPAFSPLGCATRQRWGWILSVSLKDGYIRGPAGLTPSSVTLTFCLSLLKRPSHPLHGLIGHRRREEGGEGGKEGGRKEEKKKPKSRLNPIQRLRAA